MKRILILIILSTISIILFNTRIMAADVSDYYKEILEFDEEGNLLMTTHDKKATSKITYKTLGWIIKRYDAPLDVPGQKYAVIKMKYADISYRDDPSDSAYMYCYYYGDKQDIYSAISDANSKWQQILYNYGDYVYIDEVMTVCSNGVPLGTLTSDSSNCIKYTGEVYYDYEGISGARNWASKASLLTHFDKKVKYPSMVRAPEFAIREGKGNSVEYKNNAVAIGTIGSNELGEEIYDVVQGIPVNEGLYVKAVADSAVYEMRFDKYGGSALFPVKVITTYHFKWTDYYGVAREEDVKAIRWYLIERAFSYWRVGKFTYKYLSGIKINNYAIPGGKYQVSGLSGPDIVLEQSAGYNNHISISSYTKSIKVDGGTVKGKNGLRPSIPDEDYSDVAEECVGEYKVWNDYLKIGSKVVLKKAKTEKAGTNPVTFSSEDKTFYKKGLIIPEDRLNGKNYESTGTAYYTGYKNGTVYSAEVQATEPVTIYTPVLCESSMNSTNEFNQSIAPDLSMNNVVIGKAFLINYGCTGNHLNIPGYGYRNYSEYVAVSQVRFPIEIYYDGKLYSKMTWIRIKGGASFVVPVGVKEGRYTYEIRNIAINAPGGEQYTGAGYAIYNRSIDSYAALDTGEFNVVGRIYDFKVSLRNEDVWHTVGNKDKNGNKNNSQYFMPVEINNSSVRFEVTTIGGYADTNDSIRLYLNYYFIKDGERIPVNIYRRNDKECTILGDYLELSHSQMRCVGDKELIKVSSVSDAKKGAQIWNGEIDLRGKLVVVGKGDYGKKVDYNKLKSEILKGGNIIVNADIYAVDAGTEELSYINADNWKKGCCNMWNKEGFDYKEGFIDGDFLVGNVKNAEREDYVVVGTH
ncbi:MAG: hypothetical protein E7270_00160 [Lachnospiraceae bacterium]|nr:hypothetical protein [Lachnospiraceae bacterium]